MVKVYLILFVFICHLGYAQKSQDDLYLKNFPQKHSTIKLYLEYKLISDDGLKYLSYFSKLTELHLTGTRISDIGLVHIENLRHLSVLVLLDTAISDAGLIHLQKLSNLSELDLMHTKITSEGLSYLKNLTKLSKLYLSDTKITDKGLAYFKTLTNLSELYLSNTKVSGISLLHLKNAKNLSILDLSGTKIRDKELEHLRSFSKLSKLYLSDTKITNKGLPYLKNLTKLSKLFLSNTKSSSVKVEKLKKYLLIERPAMQAFKWFDKLGFPDVKGCPLIRIATGSFYVVKNKLSNTYIIGFLLRETKKTFTVLTLNLFVETYTKSSFNLPEHKRTYYKTLNLEKKSKACLNQKSLSKLEIHQRKRGAYLAIQTEIFILAWGCYKNNLTKLAQELYFKASLIKTFALRSLNGTKKETFIRKLEENIAHSMMWRTILAFENVTVSRKELLLKFQIILKNYPRYSRRLEVLNIIKTLKAMIKEDKVYIKPTFQVIEKMKTQKQIKELIYQLRDQRGGVIWGKCNIFFHLKSPAYKLVKIGFRAVPELIKSLENMRFSRAIEYTRPYRFPHKILRISDCALQILSQIAKKNFDSQKGKRQVNKWWNRVKNSKMPSKSNK